MHGNQKINNNNVEQAARYITSKAGGNINECIDWLTDGDALSNPRTYSALAREWVKAGCSYETS